MSQPSQDWQAIYAWALLNMDQSLVLTDPNQPENPIVFASERFLAQTGYTRAEIMQRNCRFLQGPDSSPETLDDIRAALRERRTFRGEILNYRKDGTPFWNLLTISPIFAPDGKLSCFVGLQADISTIKHSEQQLLSLNKAIQRQHRELQQFTHIVSHDLRAPVANLLGLSELLTPQTRPELMERLLQGVRTAARQFDGVLSDLNALLELGSQISETHQRVVWQELAAQVLAEFSAPLADARVELDFAVSEARGSRSHLETIFRELVTNAIKFRSPERRLELRLATRSQNGCQRLEIHDNGLGIDLAAHGDRLFGLYKRLHPHIEGRGRGLYLARTLAEALGGSLTVSSRPDAGSCFTLSLPAGDRNA